MLRHSVQSDVPALIELWQICFEDEAEFPTLFFNLAYRPDNTFVYEIDGRIVAMANFLPTILHVGDRTYPASYFYGLCTHPDFERRGIAAELSKYSYEESKKRGDAASWGFPDEEKKIPYYERLGYSVCVNGIPQTENWIEMPDFLIDYGNEMIKLEKGPAAQVPDSHEYIGMINRIDKSIPEDITIYSKYTFA